MKPALGAVILLLLVLPVVSLAIPTCSPSAENVESGQVDFFDLVTTHHYTLHSPASTIGWHLKVKNPEEAKYLDYYPIMYLSLYERRPGENDYRNIKNTPESCMEPSIYLDNPVVGADYAIQVICSVGLIVEYDLHAMTFKCDLKPASGKTPSWLHDRIKYVQKSKYSSSNSENIYLSRSKTKEFITYLSKYFDNNHNPPEGTDCLDRAVYLFNAAERANIPASIVIWGPKIKGEIGHANVMIGGKLYDTTSSITDVSYFYKNYELVGLADTYEKLSFYMDPSVW
ncbi:hypothetical protein DSECCO2_22210 [anaerobic digester metagenome]